MLLRKISLAIALIATLSLNAQEKAMLRVDNTQRHQHITGFGGFVNSPQFGYNHMSETEIKRLWGKTSTGGLNIMRIYLPIGRNSWSSSLQTAKLAKQLGLIVFASPWSMPAEWKTNNSERTYTTVDGNEVIGYLKEENYEDYANYLNDYVTYLRENGVELDAISLQNEPDWKADYQGCIWTTSQMTNFLKNYGHLINCKIIAPETIGISDNYCNALLASDVFDTFDIYGGHQYAGIQTKHKEFVSRGKEVWMTEWLDNWNENKSDAQKRNFNWSIDAWPFVEAIHNAMMNDVNAWVHYAAKRYYGMIGDGQSGTTSGNMTKRGYILSQFAKYVTGTTRISDSWTKNTTGLKSSSYESVTGDSVIVMIINSATTESEVTVDLPFRTNWMKRITTSQSSNAASNTTTFDEETTRPKATIAAQSVTTLVFKKSSERAQSNMTGNEIHFQLLDNQPTTKSAFGTTYKMSNKTKTFDHSNNLISSNTTSSNGYVKLPEGSNRLVLHVNNISSTYNYTASDMTLYYVDNSGSLKSKNYGLFEFTHRDNFDWIFDLSALDGGCKGLIGLSCGNWSSVLTLKFDDVYLQEETEKGYTLSGEFDIDNSNLADCLEDIDYTMVNLENVTGLDNANLTLASKAANPNCVFIVPATSGAIGTNVICQGTCNNLILNADNGQFYPNTSFTATQATATATINGYHMLTLPFNASIPEGIEAYSYTINNGRIECTPISSIKAGESVIVKSESNNVYTFTGSGQIIGSLKNEPTSLPIDVVNGIDYINANNQTEGLYFDITGKSYTKRPTNGIFIERKGQKYIKIFK
ncbi:MAG: hypothetical protein K5874_07860 [Bacteroidaceae bacterium]|nr:hypothetical protein [Bacteroidaceae bacterium]